MSDDTKPTPKPEEEPSAPSVDEQDLEKASELLKSEESKNVLKEFDAFEVEDMPESNELQERRRKVKRRLQELEMGGLTPEEEGPLSAEEGGIMDLLKEARISPKQIFSCCAGLLVLVGLGIFFFGNVSLGVPAWVEDLFKEEPTQEEPDGENPEGDGSDVNYTDETLMVGIELGEPKTEEEDSTDTGETLGSEAQVDEHLQQWINDFSKVYESVGTDVNELLNQSSDRREALREYMEELRALQYLAEQDVDALVEEMDEMSAQFSAVEDLRDDEESRFFEELRELDAYATSAALDAFVDYGQEVVRLRAHYLAREKLLGYFEQTLPVLETKLRDIELNEEALVKGVKVIEVDGSDLELIIDESEL